MQSKRLLEIRGLLDFKLKDFNLKSIKKIKISWENQLNLEFGWALWWENACKIVKKITY